MGFPQVQSPFRPQLRNVPPGTPAPITSTANAGSAPSAPPMPAPTGPSAGEQGRAAGLPEVMTAIETLGRDLTGQQREFHQRVEQIRGELTTFSQRLEAIERSRINGSAKGNSDVHTGTFAASGFSATKFMLGLHLMKDGRHADAMRIAKREFEMCEAAERDFPGMKNILATPMGAPAAVERVMVTSSNSAGGYLLPPEFSTELIELARNKMVLNTMGARYITGLAGSPFTMPRQSGAGTPTGSPRKA